MIRSTNRELGEYDLIRRPDHVAKIWSVVESALPKYWQAFLDAEHHTNPIAQLAPKFGKSAGAADAEWRILAGVLADAVTAYEKEAEKYRRFFEMEALEEYRDDPNAFKQALSREVPVVANSLRSRRTELKDWQHHFRAARAKTLLEVFSNVLEFYCEWSTAHPVNLYIRLSDPDAFGLDPLDNDEAMYITNVVGMGIKSIVLYHLDSERLPARGYNGLYGLYFLSKYEYFDLPSKSSEFLMINDVTRASDGSIIMDQNYWYPYGLFSLYALRIFNWIDQRASNTGISLDPKCRFVYVERFFEAVCKQHNIDLKTMRAHERFEVPA